MRRRWAKTRDAEVPARAGAGEIARELEQRGVAPAFAIPVAQHLAVAPDFHGPRRAAVLDGVVAAFSAHQPDYEALEKSAENIDEIQRLMQGFAGELRKLEEGLRIVSAYVLRMHDKASGEVGKRLH